MHWWMVSPLDWKPKYRRNTKILIIISTDKSTKGRAQDLMWWDWCGALTYVKWKQVYGMFKRYPCKQENDRKPNLLDKEAGGSSGLYLQSFSCCYGYCLNTPHTCLLESITASTLQNPLPPHGTMVPVTDRTTGHRKAVLHLHNAHLGTDWPVITLTQLFNCTCRVICASQKSMI